MIDRILIRNAKQLVNNRNTGIAPIIFQARGICFGKPLRQYHIKAAKTQTIISPNEIKAEIIEIFFIQLV
jgi:hypothetical protein